MIVLASSRLMARMDRPFYLAGECWTAARDDGKSGSGDAMLAANKHEGKKMSMRILQALLGFTLMTATAHAADPTTIGVNAFPNAKALPLHAGIARGIFEKRGI